MRALIFFIAVSCQAQQSMNVETRWEYDFETANRIPDTVICYDYETTYPVPFYEIKTHVVGYSFVKMEAGGGYYILVYNKYKSVWTERTGKCFDWRYR